MVSETETVDQAEEGADETPKRKCPHCSWEYEISPRGRGLNLQHMKKEHPDKTKKALESAAAADKSAASTAELTPVGEIFATVVKRMLPNKTNIAETLIKLFNRNPQSLMTSRTKLRGWLSRYGLSQDQLMVIEDEMFGMEDEQGPAGQPGGGQQVGYTYGPDGRLAPMFIPIGGGQTPGMPTIIMPQGNNGQDLAALRTEFKEEIEEIKDSFQSALGALVEKLGDRLAPQQPQQALMFRTPALGPDGKALTTPDGQPVYVERPYSPQDSVMEMFKVFIPILADRDRKPDFDPEKFMLQLRESWPQPSRVDDSISPAMKEHFDALKVETNALVTKLNSMEHEKERKDLLDEQFRTFQTELDRRMGGINQSDSQAKLTFDRQMREMTLTWAGQLMGGMRSDMRVVIKPFVATLLKNQGFSDTVIANTVNQDDDDHGPMTPAALDRMKEAERKWLR